jgi:ubiquinone/menaquinone biosynthesis C-methylase UbiE
MSQMPPQVSPKTSQNIKMEYFLEIYGRLPRAGPGSFECTKQAFELMSEVPDEPYILDVGCGPGVQTVDLLNISGGRVLALDFLPLMLERTQANAELANVSDRLEVVEQDMVQMAFPPASFDVVWSEGAIYNLGFENGLRMVKSFVKPGGYVAVSEAVWLKADPPASVAEFWKAYPEIDTIENKLAVIDRLGYEQTGHFVLPATTWTAEYYGPMEKLVAKKLTDWVGNPVAMAVLEEAQNEIEIFREYSSYYSYGFFVMRRPIV